ncbi:hypothetical protein QLX08_008008 [Tetragonisca angustula]|uniref:Uncharacterized protein n=1 Tax=Tetragonisca angustula TaxID=166442 RepID=A0AAW0ZNX4_9HYME
MSTVRITSTPISEIVQIFTVGTKIPKIFYNLIIPCQSSANKLQHRQKRKREKMQNVYGNDTYTYSRKSPKFSQLVPKSQRYFTISSYRVNHRQTISNCGKREKEKKCRMFIMEMTSTPIPEGRPNFHSWYQNPKNILQSHHTVSIIGKQSPTPAKEKKRKNAECLSWK